MAAGECVASLAITEPDAGSDMQVGGWSILFVVGLLFYCLVNFQGARTTAKRDGEDWVINGSKIYITNG